MLPLLMALHPGGDRYLVRFPAPLRLHYAEAAIFSRIIAPMSSEGVW